MLLAIDLTRKLHSMPHKGRHQAFQCRDVKLHDPHAACMVIATVVVQVAQDPTSAMALDQLLVHPHGPGSGLCIWPASYLGFACGCPTSFCSVRKAARRKGSCAVGYRRADGRMLLVPPGDHSLTFEQGDQVVVIAAATATAVK
jgi:hypothetical protein